MSKTLFLLALQKFGPNNKLQFTLWCFFPCLVDENRRLFSLKDITNSFRFVSRTRFHAASLQWMGYTRWRLWSEIKTKTLYFEDRIWTSPSIKEIATNRDLSMSSLTDHNLVPYMSFRGSYEVMIGQRWCVAIYFGWHYAILENRKVAEYCVGISATGYDKK